MWELENQLKDHGRKVPILACCPCTYMCLPYREPKSASPFPKPFFKKKPTEKTYPKKPTPANSLQWSKNLPPKTRSPCGQNGHFSAVILRIAGFQVPTFSRYPLCVSVGPCVRTLENTKRTCRGGVCDYRALLPTCGGQF